MAAGGEEGLKSSELGDWDRGVRMNRACLIQKGHLAHKINQAVKPNYLL